MKNVCRMSEVCAYGLLVLSLAVCGCKEEDIENRRSPGGTVAEAVDLGLASGTKWASWNVGATRAEDYGAYFAWGEIETKDYFYYTVSDWMYEGYSSLMSKGVVDANGNLTAKYDAATANWGNGWRMPTKEEIEELLRLPHIRTSSNSVDGWRFSGNNGNSIFIPLASFTTGRTVFNDKQLPLYYWSSSAREDDGTAYGMFTNNGNSSLLELYYCSRFMGLPVRAVYSK